MGTDWLTTTFEDQRPRLTAVAYRVLGSPAEAEDAVQEAWIRLTRSDTTAIDNLGGWLTTVVSRVALDMLRSRRRHEDRTVPEHADAGNPEDDAVMADSVGAALLVVLDTLTPSERLAFVLHDMFAVPFDEIGTVMGRSPDAAKQLASRARAKVRGAAPADEPGVQRQREVVDAFLAASRNGEFERLVALLHPEVALRADAAAVKLGSPEGVRGPAAVAGMFSGRALAATAALIDGVPGLVWEVQGRPKVVWDFTVRDGTVVAIEMIADQAALADMELTPAP
ncbi:MAG TPA: sigma-70 family RNA polymerase sigma factor [Acidimicrobiales bacterium]|nr:sigma-70 family RNA polymerase sigma factor [Acidimicrobiales bacterium]